MPKLPEALAVARKPNVRLVLGLQGRAQLEARYYKEAEAMLSQPAQSLRLSARYLKKLLDAFGGNVALAAAAYNAGPQALRRWLEGGKGLSLDVFVARIPYAETLEYVERIVGNYARYRYLEAGASAVPRLTLELPAASPASGVEY